jgi:NAD(P)-dependent dehydrogenase (short-subunit alcohol dehydrogenase family)
MTSSDRESRGTALLTGGTRGIGLVTAEKLCARGLRVLLTGRDQKNADEAAAGIRARITGASVEGLSLDLASLDSVRALGASFAERDEPLRVLVANAGVMESSPEVKRSKDGFELMFAANHLGHFLLTMLLLPHLRRNEPSRVVVVSSRWHAPGSSGPQVDFDFDDLEGRRSYDPTVAYKNSKLANLWFTFALARRLQGTRTTVNAVCPGFVPATLADHQHGLQRFLTKHLLPLLPRANSPEEAAENTAYVATDPAFASRSAAFVGEQKEVAASDEARDAAKAERLWTLSCALTGLPADPLSPLAL